ncbi:MAG TPA: GspH/FimT family pseudopilin [Burkholderiaceae bacterium]|nr:GspH/FimT family pseudopilin [Burkholderiaceae bacterium]
MSSRSTQIPAQRGVSLIEAMCALVIVSLTIGGAVPSLASLRQRAELAGAAAQLETDVQFARGQAVALNRTVQLSLREANGATCYIVHTGPAANCVCNSAEPNTASCSGGAELLRAVSFANPGPVQVRSASKSLTFEPVWGTVTPTATLRVEARDGQAIHQVVNLLGRVRSCSPQGRVTGERAC